MDFSLEEEQKLLAETLARFVQKDYGFEARRATLASDAGVSLRAWAALAEMGALGLPVSSEYGGYGGGAVETMVAMQAFGRGLLAEPYFATVVVGAGLVQRAGSDAQRAAILPAVVEGRLRLALAHGEAGARYELAQVVTRAAALGQAGGGGWKLDGAKSVVLHGAQAGTLIVSARTSGQDRDASGISLFLVPRDAPGVLVRDYRTIDGLRAAEVSLTGVAVGADALLGPEGGALPLLEESRDRAIAALAAEAVGTMEALSEQTLDYIRQRQQFGHFRRLPVGLEVCQRLPRLVEVKLRCIAAVHRQPIVDVAGVALANECCEPSHLGRGRLAGIPPEPAPDDDHDVSPRREGWCIANATKM